MHTLAAGSLLCQCSLVSSLASCKQTHSFTCTHHTSNATRPRRRRRRREALLRLHARASALGCRLILASIEHSTHYWNSSTARLLYSYVLCTYRVMVYYACTSACRGADSLCCGSWGSHNHSPRSARSSPVVFRVRACKMKCVRVLHNGRHNARTAQHIKGNFENYMKENNIKTLRDGRVQREHTDTKMSAHKLSMLAMFYASACRTFFSVNLHYARVRDDATHKTKNGLCVLFVCLFVCFPETFVENAQFF